MSGVWTIKDSTRPWTANAERRMHFSERARLVKATRERFFWLAKQAAIPHLEAITIEAHALCADQRWRPDVAACYPAVKAAIDGLVDAEVIPDDNEHHLKAITFYPRTVCGRDGLLITVREVA